MHIKVIHKPSQKVLPDGVDFEVTQKVFYVNRREDTYTALFDMVARFRLDLFNSVAVLDLTDTDPELEFFHGGHSGGWLLASGKRFVSVAR